MSGELYGHKTYLNSDGSFRHEILSKDEASEIMQKADEAKAKRLLDMPTERDAIAALMEAYVRLTELGWRDATYCPKDGSVFSVIEAGSTGIHPCSYYGEWPKGSWWIHGDGDMWPSRPILFKDIDNDK